MQRRNFLISLIFTLFSSCKFLKNPFTSEEPKRLNPEDYEGDIEFKYVRVEKVVYPYYPDPTDDCANIHPGAVWKTSPFVKVEENVWTCYVRLPYSNGYYWFWLRDKKISWIYTIAHDVFARRKGTDEPWLKLTCIEPLVVNPSGGECVKFIWDKQGVRNP